MTHPAPLQHLDLREPPGVAALAALGPGGRRTGTRPRGRLLAAATSTVALLPVAVVAVVAVGALGQRLLTATSCPPRG